MLGLAAVDVVPSPKFQLREAIVPSLSVEVSVNCTVSPLADEVKFAAGGVFVPPPPQLVPEAVTPTCENADTTFATSMPMSAAARCTPQAPWLKFVLDVQ